MKSATKYHLLNNKDYDEKLRSDNEDEEDDDSLETNSQSSSPFDKKRYDNWPTLLKNTAMGDGGDIRRPVFNSLYKKPTLSTSLIQDEVYTSTLDKDDTHMSWQMTNKRLTKAMLHADTEEDSVDTKSLSNRSNTLSEHSRTSLEAKTSDFDNETQLLNSTYALRQQFSPDKLLNTSSTLKREIRTSAANLVHEHDINYITLIGLMVGLLLSKTLQYVFIYFDWLLRQVVQLRVAFFGDCSFMTFFNFEDNSRYSLRYKLILMPVMCICGVLYSLVIVLHYSLRLLLSQAPNFLVNMLQKVYQDS